jgi:hypothetical protein
LILVLNLHHQISPITSDTSVDVDEEVVRDSFGRNHLILQVKFKLVKCIYMASRSNKATAGNSNKSSASAKSNLTNYFYFEKGASSAGGGSGNGSGSSQ